MTMQSASGDSDSDGLRSPERGIGREAFVAACRRRVSRATGVVVAIALALTAALAGIVSQTAAGHTSKQPRTPVRKAPPAAPPAPDTQQVYPDPTAQSPQAYPPPGAVVTRSS